MTDVNCSIAVAHAWSIELASAEKEVSLRLSLASENIGIKCYHINNCGYIFGEDFKETGRHISSIPNVKFVLHTHFSSNKTYDIWTIFPLWNPPKFIYDWPQPDIYSFYITQHDDYAISTSPKTAEHINMLLQAQNRYFDNKQILFPSLSQSQIIEPCLNKIKEFRLFYCGMAWERSANQPPRLNTVFKHLDEMTYMDFYGPKSIGSFPTWEGFKSYRGEIPFDGGRSLLKTMNDSGLSLALSSLIHTRMGIMSNRLFESLAAGTLAITDKNEFVSDHFGDSVMMVENHGDQYETFDQIRKAVAWAKEHPEVAQEKAKAAQEIFEKQFTLEPMLKRLIDDLPIRKQILSNQIYSQLDEDTIDVLALWTANSLEELGYFLDSVNRQLYGNIRIIFICDNKISANVENIFSEKLLSNISYEIKGLDLLNWAEDPNDLGFRKMTTGQMLRAGYEELKNEFITFYVQGDIWYSDHLTTLKRIFENDPKLNIAYAPFLKSVYDYEKIINYARDYWEEYTTSSLLDNPTSQNSVGTILAKKTYLERTLLNGLNGILTMLDYMEFSALMLNAVATNTAVYSKRTTYEKRYYMHGRTPRGKRNEYEFLLYPIKMQQELIYSYARFKFSDIDFFALNKMKNTLLCMQQQINVLEQTTQNQSPSPVFASNFFNFNNKNVSFFDIARSYLNIKKQMHIVKKSTFWDEKYYKSNYGHEINKMKPIQHYFFVGSKKGYNPSKFFDTTFYLNTYPDIAANGMNPLFHYIHHGRQEGRRPTP